MTEMLDVGFWMLNGSHPAYPKFKIQHPAFKKKAPAEPVLIAVLYEKYPAMGQFRVLFRKKLPGWWLHGQNQGNLDAERLQS